MGAGLSVMISTLQLFIVAILYVCLLFFIAYYSDKHKPNYTSSKRKALVYSFSLAVYCSSWTFYGAVGSASETGWGYLPIYLGPILMYTVGWPFIKRFVELAHQQNATSISDFIASRYDKSQTIASLVTIIAVVATIPYIALQLKAITLGIQAFDFEQAVLFDQYSNAFYITIILIVFSILFGTRNIEVTEHQYGMMNAIAFESIVKLCAFLAVGFFALFHIFDGPGDLYNTILATPRLKNLFMSTFDWENFITQTFLAAGAIFCLPRQFHVSVVEYHQEKDQKYARVIFPIYLTLFSFFVIPIVLAGSQVFNNSAVSADFYVLFLPISQDQNWLSVLSFIGGLSAATGMVIVATVTLSTMVSNDLILPNFLKLSRKGIKNRSDWNVWILFIRRGSIAFLLLGSYAFYRIIDTTQSLASFGLVSFSAVIQFAPPLVIGMYWSRANKSGALTGLICGIVCWLYFIWPALTGSSLLAKGIGLTDMSILTEAVLFSMLANVTALIIFSLNRPQTLTEKIQSFVYTKQKPYSQYSPVNSDLKHEIRVRDLKSAASFVIGKKRTEAWFSNYSPSLLNENQIVDKKLIDYTEKMLSGVIGAPSARELLLSVLKDKGMEVENVFSLLSSTSLALKFNRTLLDATMENIAQGINVIDSEHKLVGWNKSYVSLMEYPDGFLQMGMPIEEVVHFNVVRGYFEDKENKRKAEVNEHIKYLEGGSGFQFERKDKNGRVIEIRGKPLPDGGWVNTYTDISNYKEIEAELRFKEQQIALYTNNVPAALAYVDKNRIVRFSNKYFAESYGLSPEEIIGMPIEQVMPEEKMEQNDRYINAALSGNKQQFESSNDKGLVEYYINTFIPDSSNAGEILGMYFISQDITLRIKAELALQEINVTLENRVLSRTEDLNNIVLELEKAKNSSEKAVLSKTRFMAAASHDLMQPFNAARLFCELLKTEAEMMTPQQVELINKTDLSLNVAGNIIQSLVEFIKLDSGNIKPQIIAFPLQELLTQLEEQFTDIAFKKNITFKILKSDEIVRSDPKLLYRIFQNLVSNAIGFTGKGGILVTNRIRGDEIQVSIWDTGEGIEEDVIDQIFDEFKRFRNSETSTEEAGLGLGLSISQRTADMLEHNISVRSEPGRGSVFHVFVDRADQNIPETKPKPKNRRKFFNDIKNKNVLCVDNNLQTLEAMAELMTSWNYNVRTASDIADIDMLIEEGYFADILVVDYQLDDNRTGLEFAKNYFERSGKRTSVIFVTANYSDEVSDIIKENGHSIVYKPIKPDVFRMKLAQLLA